MRRRAIALQSARAGGALAGIGAAFVYVWGGEAAAHPDLDSWLVVIAIAGLSAALGIDRKLRDTKRGRNWRGEAQTLGLAILLFLATLGGAVRLGADPLNAVSTAAVLVLIALLFSIPSGFRA